MTKEQEVVDKLLSFAFAMSENMVGLTKQIMMRIPLLKRLMSIYKNTL